MIVKKSQMDNDEGSKGYSVAMIYYFFNAQSLFGMGNLPHSGFGFDLRNDNIGYVSSFLDILFIFLFLVQTVKNVFSRDELKHYVGLSCMYFCLHTSKMGVQTFSFFYISFFTILLFLVNIRSTPPNYIKVNR